MARHQIADVRNIALVGHGAVGKTTLADHLLFRTGMAPRAGSVVDGSSLLDTDDEEKQHKYSISSHIAHFQHGGKRFNLFDDPGYPDFIGQVVGSLRAAETAAIVLSAGPGIESNTRRCFAKAAGMGRMIIVNKFDLENVDYETLVDSIRETFGKQCVPLNVPVGSGHNFSAVVSTLNPPATAPAGCLDNPSSLNQVLLDAIVEADEALMERFLNGETFASDEVSQGLRKAVAAGTLIPILFCSAKTEVGLPELLEAFKECALSPLDLPRTAQKGSETVTLTADENGPLVAQVFKTKIDSFIGKMSFLRIFSGSIHKDDHLHTSSHAGKNIKIGAILDVQGAKSEPVDFAGPGDIIAVVKVEDLKLGDTVTRGSDVFQMPAMDYPTPMIGLAVEPKSRNDQQKISTALHKIEEEDPTFRVSRDAQTKEIVVHGMSELHLQIAQEKLHKRDKVDVVVHPPKIPYHETVAGTAEGSYRHKKQSGGSGQFAEVHFRISALPQGIKPEEYFTPDRFPSIRHYHYDPSLNIAFVDRVTGGSVPNNFIPAVEKGVRERIEQGVLAGFHVQDVTCELFFGKDHPVDSNETAFKIAGNMCFKEVFQKAKPAILEPIVHLEITVPGDKLGDITSDLNSRRGRVEGMDAAPGGFQVVHARAPLSEVMTYARTLSSITGGQGSFTMEMSHYDMVPPNEQQKIVATHAKHHTEEV